MNVLCVVAHPDDEVLGFGGALAKHAANGDTVVVHSFVTRLVNDARRSIEVLGASYIEFGGFPDQELGSLPVSHLSRRLEHDTPDVVYTHHPGDLNDDHRMVAQAVLAAFRPKPDRAPCTILAGEVLSSTEWTFPQQFRPNWFVDLSGEHWHALNKKVEALKCYPSEVQPPPHPRNEDGIMALAQVRGQQCGVRYAEAFELLRRGPC